MTGPTLDELIARVRGELSEEDDAFFTDAIVTRALSAGQDDAASKCPWACVATFSTATVDNSARYRLPIEVIAPTATYVEDSSGNPERMDYDEPDNFDGYGTRTFRVGWSKKVTYRHSDNGIILELYPTPNVTGRAIHVSALVRPTPMADPTDRTDLHPMMVEPLINYALWRLKNKDEEVTQGKEYRMAYDDAIRDLQARRMLKQADQLNRTRGRRAVSRTTFGRMG